jgi:hypothetical protein
MRLLKRSVSNSIGTYRDKRNPAPDSEPDPDQEPDPEKIILEPQRTGSRTTSGKESNCANLTPSSGLLLHKSLPGWGGGGGWV